MKLVAIAALAVLFAFPAHAQESYFRLFIYFSTPDKPEPHAIPGWTSRSSDSMEQCVSRRDNITNYIKANVPENVKFTAFCVEFHAHGFEEGMEAFRKRIGDLA